MMIPPFQPLEIYPQILREKKSTTPREAMSIIVSHQPAVQSPVHVPDTYTDQQVTLATAITMHLAHIRTVETLDREDPARSSLSRPSASRRKPASLLGRISHEQHAASMQPRCSRGSAGFLDSRRKKGVPRVFTDAAALGPRAPGPVQL